ncbi:MAG: hypothetical protein E2O93_09255, partial [Alphaproteobacteria bacterium]
MPTKSAPSSLASALTSAADMFARSVIPPLFARSPPDATGIARQAATGIQFPWHWDGGTISVNSGDIREMSVRILGRLGTETTLLLNAVFVLGLYGLILYLHYMQPVAYFYVTAEDYWAEWGTFVAWFLCFALLVWAMAGQKRLRNPGLILLAIGSLLIALEEISWGQRILGFQTPEFLASSNKQGEATLHNLSNFQPERTIGYLLILWSVVPILLRPRMTKLFGWLDRLGVVTVPVRVWPLFLFAGVFLINHPWIRVQGDEIAEFFLALAFAGLALDLARPALGNRGPARAGGAYVVAMFAVMFLLTALLVLLFPLRQDFAKHLTHWAAYRYPIAGLYDQSLEIFEYTERREEFRYVGTRYQHAYILTRVGRKEEAAVVLDAALREREQNPASDPPASIDSLRTIGKIHSLAGRGQTAGVIFDRALEEDYRRLEQSADGSEIARIHWSIGKT